MDINNGHRWRYVPALFSFAATFGFSISAYAAGPFDGFAGSWRGSGNVVMTDGSREAIRCRASYAAPVGGNALNVDVVCASDSYRINLTSNVVADGSEFSGSWREDTTQSQGDVTGRIPARGAMQASLQTVGGGMELAARINGKQMAVTVQSQGSRFQAMNLILRKN